MNKMRELRKQAGLTMKELGGIVGVSESTISLYERGQHEPDLVTLGRIAERLHCSVDYLLGREEMPETKKEPAPKGGQDRDKAILDSLNPENRAKAASYLEYLLTTQDTAGT